MMQSTNRRTIIVLAFAGAAASLVWVGCGGSGSGSSPNVGATSSAGTASGSTSLAAVYKAAAWASAATVTFSGSCSMTVTSTGVPPYHNDYYLAPVSTQYPASVAVTPVTGTEMALVPYMPADINGASMTFNICPAKAATTTATSGGSIGTMISGEALYDPYEANGSTPALSDNVSYTFTTSAGVTETASFIDACNSHPTPISGGYMWHHHAVPTCLAAQIDGTSGPSHLIGVALDGFPIYGGRDINGNTIAVSQLDACNGITSPTPEFPNGIYHYVLPIGVTGKQSSLNCFAGSVSSSQVAAATRYICGLDMLDRRLQAAARARRLGRREVRSARHGACDRPRDPTHRDSEEGWTHRSARVPSRCARGRSASAGNTCRRYRDRRRPAHPRSRRPARRPTAAR
jgi:hypothetical protein